MKGYQHCFTQRKKKRKVRKGVKSVLRTLRKLCDLCVNFISEKKPENIIPGLSFI